MSTAVERIVNLALFLAATRQTVTAERIRAEVFGYPANQDDDAFIRMFERDKKDLARMGFSVVADTEGNYRLDSGASFATSVAFSASEAAAIRVAAAALLGDPSFPFASDLRLALAKISAEVGSDTAAPASARLADEEPGAQGAVVAQLSAAAAARKLVRFDYTNSRGAFAPHEIEPYGLFLHDGRWYLVGRDIAKDEVRTYTVGRMSTVVPNGSKPETPDFERPATFDVARYAHLPFQFGNEPPFEARLRFVPEAAWRVRALTGGHGSTETQPDGSVVWTVETTSHDRLLRFVLENGPGISVEAPDALRAELAERLAAVVMLHV